ncbi:MAG: hypothetical protein WC701_10585 [Kiritimatiellales bacterium]|jgi:hypothetical protein
MNPRFFFLFMLLSALPFFSKAAEKELAYYGLFDIERKPELICSHAGAGLPDLRFVAEPKRTGSASLALDINLPDRKASGRFLFPVPHVRFQEISFWLNTDQLGRAKLEITPQLMLDNLQLWQLGDNLEFYKFRPVIISGGNGWQQVRLKIPEDIINLKNDTKQPDERAFLMFEFKINLAKESADGAWKGSVFLDQLEFLGPNRGAVLPAVRAARTADSGTVGADLKLRMQFVHRSNEMAYFILDDGEGRWITTAQGISTYPLELTHSYCTPGEKARQWQSVSITGNRSPWNAAPVKVTGESLPEPVAVPAVYTTSADPSKSVKFPDRVNGTAEYDKLWIASHFEKLMSLDQVQLHAGTDGKFPADFEIETTLDGGQTWQTVPCARFLKFPNPGDRAVTIPLNGVVANGLRVVSFRRDADAAGKYALALGSIQTFRKDGMRFEAAGIDQQRMAAWNNLWLTFGSAKNEIHDHNESVWMSGRPYSGGMLAWWSTEWALWNAMKMIWFNSEYLPAMESMLAGIPVETDGYVWVAEHEEKHLGHTRHYDIAPIYISAVSYYVLMTRDLAFLDRKDPKTGEPIRSKIRRAMRMLTDDLGGASGLITLKDPELQGTSDSKSSNYWDSWVFGHQDADMNAHYYEAVGYYADLLEALGDNAEAARFRTLRATIKDEFNKAFWDDAKGRYIGWIDKNGKRVDFGFVFVNLKALAVGLATSERAGKVMDWIDGRRTVAGDTATGADIYHYKFSPRLTTLAAESGKDNYFKLFFGGDTNTVGKGGAASWGLSAQNGGTIFFISYYDLHARQQTLGTDSAIKRMDVILDEAKKDDLRRMPKNPVIGVGTPVGIIREFPESGLVPFYFVDGVMGLKPAPEGLRIAPAFPKEWKQATIRDFYFAGKPWTITADCAVDKPQKEIDGDGRTHLIVPAGKNFLLAPDGTLTATDTDTKP